MSLEPCDPNHCPVCPVCNIETGGYYLEECDSKIYDDTSITLKGGRHISEFCGLECIAAFLEQVNPDELVWMPCESHFSWMANLDEGGMHCGHCAVIDLEKGVSPSDSRLHFRIDGWHGSFVDGGVLFCSITCGIAYIRAHAFKSQKENPYHHRELLESMCAYKHPH